MIADASRFREVEEYDGEEFSVDRSSRMGGGRELTGRAKFARASRHSRGGGKAKLFNGSHLRRRDRHVAW
jgi:hypothetical protein